MEIMDYSKLKAYIGGNSKDPLNPGEMKIHPGFSIDCIVLSFHEGSIQVILSELLKDKWVLPGGFMYKDEQNTDIAAARILEERSGVKNIYMKQFHLFSEMGRNDDLINNELVLEKLDSTIEEVSWLTQRFISLGYISFIKYDEVTLDEDCRWFDLNNLPTLQLDHGAILKRALDDVLTINNFIPIGFGMLPHKFTITELREVQEALTGVEYDRRNFQRTMLNNGVIIKLSERKDVTTYPKPILFEYNPKILEKLFS